MVRLGLESLTAIRGDSGRGQEAVGLLHVKQHKQDSPALISWWELVGLHPSPTLTSLSLSLSSPWLILPSHLNQHFVCPVQPD